MSASLSFLRSSDVKPLSADKTALTGPAMNFSASAAFAPFAKASTISALFAAATSFNLAIISALSLAFSGVVVLVFSNSATEVFKALSKLAKNSARAASSAGLTAGLASKAAISFGLATGLRTVTPARAGSFTGLSAGLAAGAGLATGLSAAGAPEFTISEIFKVDGVVEVSTLSSAFTTEV